ncbi:protein arginine N-methyltransferase 7-like [Panonychus citri]|uniref:protein arginine N-methyltransferase 7-like n=1 Tax=Panonychus citri TaxID=50023 RepID=UPI0023073E38|nr:protein arginine N-methyltransferase 7-like [Panonychus citri]
MSLLLNNLSSLKCPFRRILSPPLTMNIDKRLAFVQKFNPLTCNLEWTYVPEVYDYVQEIARSDYGDMLWDQERNILYNKAIAKCCEKLVEREPDTIRAIDIGTGTGLLSMMVVRQLSLLKRSVEINAFECFPAMAECAKKVIETNGYSKSIKVIESRSDEAEVLEPEERASLLVSEVFDTELIGEGALRVFKTALLNHCKPNPLVVPHKARIWVQLVKSPWLNNGHCLAPRGISIDGNKLNISIPSAITHCYGSNHLHDLQANQLVLGKDIDLISDPVVAFTFDFSDIESLKYDDQTTIEFVLKKPLIGEFVNIVFWWDLLMDDEAEFVLTCAPYWAHPTKGIGGAKNKIPWRDHWMQAIYYLPAYYKPFTMEVQDIFKLNCYHDEYSFWFDIGTTRSTNRSNFCSCGIHNDLSRNRIRMMTDEKVLSTIYPPIFTEINGKRDLNILFLGDASLIPILVAKDLHETGKVYVLKRDQTMNSRFYEEFGRSNEILNRLVIVDEIQQIEQIQFDIILGEPFFDSIILPWDAFHFWYLIGDMAEKGMVTMTTKIFPSKGRIKMLPVSFDHLWKTKAKLGKSVEGFDLTDFDNLIEKAREISDTPIEPQSLWEYPCKALTNNSETVFEFDFRLEKLTKKSKYTFEKLFKIDGPNEYNNLGLTFWAEFDFANKILNSGPMETIKKGQYVSWNRNWKQGMSIIQTSPVATFLPKDFQVQLNIEYDCSIGSLNLKAQPVDKKIS